MITEAGPPAEPGKLAEGTAGGAGQARGGPRRCL